MAAGEHLCGRRKTFVCGSRGAFCAVAGKHFFVSRGAFVRQKGSILWQQESICLAEEELFKGLSKALLWPGVILASLSH